MKTLIRNIGQIVSGDIARPLLDGDTIAIDEGRIAAVGRGLDGDADTVIDAHVQGFMGGFGQKPEEMTKVYSNFVWVLEPGEKPESAIPRFSVYSAWTCRTGASSTSWARPKSSQERIRAEIAALGGCEWVVLNPLDWSARQLDLLAERVLPLVHRP